MTALHGGEALHAQLEDDRLLQTLNDPHDLSLAAISKVGEWTAQSARIAGTVQMHEAMSRQLEIDLTTNQYLSQVSYCTYIDAFPDFV